VPFSTAFRNLKYLISFSEAERDLGYLLTCVTEKLIIVGTTNQMDGKAQRIDFAAEKED
jgi:hypothetical protein